MATSLSSSTTSSKCCSMMSESGWTGKWLPQWHRTSRWWLRPFMKEEAEHSKTHFNRVDQEIGISKPTFRISNPFKADWQVKRTLTGELDGRFRIVAHDHMWYIYIYIYFCRTFIYWRVHGRFYGLHTIWLSRWFQENSCTSTKSNHGYARIENRHQWRFEDMGGNNWIPGKGCWSFILTKWLHALAVEVIQAIHVMSWWCQNYSYKMTSCSGSGGDTSYSVSCHDGVKTILTK